MSCQPCDDFQENHPEATYYYRWKNANIEIRGCEQHVEEVMEALSAAQKL